MVFNVVTSTNINTPGAKTLVSKIAEGYLKVFEPELFFWRFGEAPISEKGHDSVTWIKPVRMELTPAQALLSPGVTPTSQNMKLETVVVAAKQYGLYVTLSDEVLDRMSGRQLPTVAGDLVGANMARIIDRVVQDAVLDNAQNRFYASTTSGGARAANRAALTANHKMFAFDLTDAHRRLQVKYAPYRNGEYSAILHTNVAHWILTENTQVAGFLSANQYSRPDKIDKGELGKWSNVRMYVTPFVKTYNNGTINVYPTLFLGMQAYGSSQLQAMEVIMQGLGSGGTADPLKQRMTIGAKTYFATTILQQDSVLVFESAGYEG